MEKIWERIWRRKKRKGEEEGGGGGSDKENDTVGRRGEGREGVKGNDEGRSRQGGIEGVLMRKGQGDEGGFMRRREEEEVEDERPQRVVVTATDGKT